MTTKRIMLTRHTGRDRRDISRRGVSTVEFAITAPLLFLIVFGLIEMSRMYNIDGTCLTVAYGAAREASLEDASASQVVAMAEAQLAAMGIPDHSVNVTPATLTPLTTEVTVSVDVPLNHANGFFFTRHVAGQTIRRSITRQREFQ